MKTVRSLETQLPVC